MFGAKTSPGETERANDPAYSKNANKASATSPARPVQHPG